MQTGSPWEVYTMLFSALFNCFARSRPASRPPTKRPGVRLHLEALEDRTVPSFTGPTALPGVPAGNLVRVADFNNDSRPDLVTVNGPNLNVAMNTSPGIYSQTLHASFTAAITDVAVGKINADAYPDIVVATGQKTVSVFLGRGDGTFQSLLSINLPSGPNSGTQFGLNLAIGDLNGDGKADLVVGAESATYNWNVGKVGQLSKRRDSLATVLIGKGDGTFKSGSTVVVDSHDVTSSTPVHLVPVAIGDLNGDGKPDVVAAGYGIYAYVAEYPSQLMGDYHIHLLTGDGQGNLQENYRLWSGGFGDGGWGVPSLAVRDLNGDGLADIVAAFSSSSQPTLHISVSDPSTGIFLPTVSSLSGPPLAVAVGDINGDGKLDLVITLANGGGVSVQPGNGDGTFQAGQTFAAGSTLNAVAVADLNGDGRLDLVVGNAVDGFSVLLNDEVW
jgi:hypothetical protein